MLAQRKHRLGQDVLSACALASRQADLRWDHVARGLTLLPTTCQTTISLPKALI